MKRYIWTFVLAVLVLLGSVTAALADAGTAWNCPQCGQRGNVGNFCPNCSYRNQNQEWDCPRCGRRGNRGNYCSDCAEPKPDLAVYALATDRLSINAGPGTSRYFAEIGTYKAKGEYVRVFAKSWDTDNGIWWILCAVPGSDQPLGWTGLKRFDQSTFDLNSLPEVFFDRGTCSYIWNDFYY